MNIEFVGKFYDNHSLSIVNRNLVLGLDSANINVRIIPLDEYSPEYVLRKDIVKKLKNLETKEFAGSVDVQIRHTYPPLWNWPDEDTTKVVYIQPWEFSKAPFEWQYKFETFADALITPSQFCSDVFLRGGIRPDKIFNIPNGYNPEIFNREKPNEKTLEKYGIDSSKHNFVFVGNSQWRKGVDLLLNSWHKIFKSYDNARLIIKDNPAVYGDNNLLHEIIKLQYTTGCAEIIYIKDSLSDEEMADIYKASKVIVHPYRAEGFGMHIQEAIACGCIPIVSAKGPTEEFVMDEGGIKLPVNTVPININDPKVFALKPGDSSSLMGSHTFINEPSIEALQKAMSYVYFSHNKANLEEMPEKNALTDWDSVVKQYIQILETIALRQPIR